jgi:DNA mismatch endonuclease (patch repair protein)
MDSIDPSRRSENMRRIRNKNTKPELILRSMLHRKGYRFRLHRKDLPGKPDIVFPSLRKAIFVHGCFWHQHNACREGRLPGSRLDYWKPKLKRNQVRDAAALLELKSRGWDVIVVWECELGDEIPAVIDRLEAFLNQVPASTATCIH